jgi:DNA/RNA endonuclease G (NUC1)
MKRVYFLLVCLAFIAVAFGLNFNQNAKADTLVSPTLVISQFQTGGVTATDEFIELHNISSSSVDLNGYRVVYRSAGGTTDVAIANWTTSTIIPGGAYYLIASSPGYDDTVTPDATYNPSNGSMSGTGGGIAIRNGAANTGTIIDSVGYGTATNAFIETAVTAAAAANSSQARLGNGCQDTDNNSSDFSTLNPSMPRNLASPANTCGGGGTGIQVTGQASPAAVNPGAVTLLTATVTPATTPPSTGITAAVDLTAVGGSATQTLYDDGTHGDVTAGDNIFSFSYTVPAATTGGSRNLLVTVTDAQARSGAGNISLTINGATAAEDHMLLGNPTGATADVANSNNYLMLKPQYDLSYNNSKGEPNWVAWHLDSTWIGSAQRQDDFRPDPALPAAFYHVTDSDYSGSGYDRGHMCPSGDRTRSIPDNSATFLMTNFVPQLAANNQGPWNDFENYCRTLAQSGNELYIYSGGAGTAGTIANGHVNIPLVTWKVVLVLPVGDNDLQRVNRNTRTIAIVVPNQPPLTSTTPWRNFRTTVKGVEALTGYNFYSNLGKNTATVIKRRRDTL